MPSEIRQILFRPAEAARALMDHMRLGRRNTPGGDVVECFAEQALPGQGVTLVVVLDPSRDLPRGETSELQRLVLSGEELAAALITFCETSGIPLPRRGEKTVQRFGDRIGMVITMDDDPMPLHAAASGKR